MSVDELTELATGDRPGRPRPTMIALLALASLAVAIGLILLTQRDGRALSELRIREANVDVRSGSSDFRQGIEGEPLEPNDAVRTDVTGQAQIDFFDESLTRLDSDTTLILRGLKDSTPGGVLSTLEAGRSWNRVEPAENVEDRYEVRGVTGVASALGTTFVSDCRQAPTCYYLGIEGETEVTSGEDQLVIGPEECARAEENLLRNCTDHEFDALMDDWVDENVAFDGGQIIEPNFDPASPSLSPSPLATAEQRATFGPRRRAVPRPPTPSPTPTRRTPPTRTPEPPTPTPTRSPSPAPTTAAPPTTVPPPTDPPTESPTITPAL